MANIGKMALILSADSTQLKSGFDRAMRDVDQFKSKITKALNFATSGFGLGAIGGSIGGALGADALKDKFKESINSIVEMDKEATKLGFTIKDLSALMTIEGPDFKTDELLDGVRKLQQATQDALDPKSEQGKLFAKHGLDPIAMLGAGTLGSLKMFAEAMAKATDSSERLKLALGTMGKAGHTLIPFLTGGPSAITDAMEEARKKGQEVTFEMARDAKEVALAIDSIVDAWTSVKNKLAVKIAPTVKQAVTGGERVLSGDVKPGELWDAVAEQIGPLTLLDALQKSAKGAPSIKDLFPAPAFLQKPKAELAVETRDQEQARLRATFEQRFKEMTPQREAVEAEHKAKIDQALGIQRQIEAGINWVQSATGAAGDFFRKGEGKLMQRQEDRIAKIADVAQGMLNQPDSMPKAAMFGSQESIELMSRSINWGGQGQGDLRRIAEAAEKQVAEEEKQHKELMRAIEGLGVMQGAF